MDSIGDMIDELFVVFNKYHYSPQIDVEVTSYENGESDILLLISNFKEIENENN